jgi:hypothetical protein
MAPRWFVWPFQKFPGNIAAVAIFEFIPLFQYTSDSAEELDFFRPDLHLSDDSHPTTPSI